MASLKGGGMEEEALRACDAVASQRARAPKLREEADKLEQVKCKCTERHMYRRSLHLASRIEELKRKADFLESGQLEHRIEEKKKQYENADVNLKRVQHRTMSRLGVIETEKDRRGTLIDEFRADLGIKAPQAQIVLNDDTCPMCSKALLLVQLKALLTCPECGYATPHIDATTGNMGYNEDSYDFTSFHYKRITHFDEVLKQIQAKENTIVDDSIVLEVMRELAKKRVAAGDVTHVQVREALRVLKCRKAYEHVAQITSRITGLAPPRIDEETEERCRTMCKTPLCSTPPLPGLLACGSHLASLCLPVLCMQPFFERHCPADRKNFLVRQTLQPF